MTLTAALERSKKQGRKFLFAGRDNGWDAVSFISDRDVFTLHMLREDTGEKIRVSWRNGFVEEPIVYWFDGATENLPDVKTAIEYMLSEPEVDDEPEPVSTRVEEKPRAIVAAKKLPFVVGETPESDICAAVFGKKIVWVNTLSGKREEAVVRGSKHLRIVSGQAGRPILTFVDTAVTGFRSVALEKILQVS